MDERDGTTPGEGIPTSDTLSAELARIAAEASAMRGTAVPPTTSNGRAAGVSELTAVAQTGHVVERFLADVFEAVKQVLVAGLAFPDPELPDELANLADRARRLRLPTGVERLLRVRAYLRAIAAEKSTEARQRHASGAFGETQRLVAWLRMYRIEHDLLAVQGKMAAVAAGGTAARDAHAYETRSLTAWPIGLSLDGIGKLLLYCQDLDSGRAVILRDQLTEWDAVDPLHGPAISRLFQDSVRLGQVLSGVIRLEDHPVVDRPDALLFRPAFRAIPRRLPVAAGFDAPRLPDAQVDARGLSPDGAPKAPGSVRVQVERNRAGLTLKREQRKFIELAMGPTLRLNLTKLLARRGLREAWVDLAVLPREENFEVLHLRTDLDERVFPVQDPTLFRIPRKMLAKRAEEIARANGSPTVLNTSLRMAAYLQGGASAEDLESLRTDLAAAPKVGLSAHYRAGLSAFLLGATLESDNAVAVARDTLRIAAQSDAADVDIAQLARVLGRAAHEVSAGDARLVDGQMVYRALWLALFHEAEDALLEECENVYLARYAGELKEPSVGDVCARAILLTLVDASKTATGTKRRRRAKTPAGGDPGTSGALEPEFARAAEFLQAHLEDFTPRPGRSTKVAPLPEPIEIVQLGDTLAYVHGAERHAPTAAPLGLSREKLAQTCADALADWLSVHPTAGRETLEAATDALLLTASANLGGWLVES